MAFLVNRPYFYNANGRFQAILSANITDASELLAPNATASEVLFLTTEQDMNLTDICKHGTSFRAVVSTK